MAGVGRVGSMLRDRRESWRDVPRCKLAVVGRVAAFRIDEFICHDPPFRLPCGDA